MLEKTSAIAEEALSEMIKLGADGASCGVSVLLVREVNAENGEITLFRTAESAEASLYAVRGMRAGAATAGVRGPVDARSAAADALALAEASEPDWANGVAEPEPGETRFGRGSMAPDDAEMIWRIREFIGAVKAEYPKIVISEMFLRHEARYMTFQNTSGVRFDMESGVYRGDIMFCARDGDAVSSFNGLEFSSAGLDSPLIERFGIRGELELAARMTRPRRLRGKADCVIIAPRCLEELIGYYELVFLSDGALISGTSPLSGKLHQKVATDCVSLYSKPAGDEVFDGYFITRDGFRAKNAPLIENGALKNFELSRYAAEKTGRPRSPNTGGCPVMPGGDRRLREIIGDVDRGVLFCRFSGGVPSENGDFSGVMKNSLLIENGEITDALSETMISGNIRELLMNVAAASSERLESGGSLLPWVMADGVLISG